MVLFEVGSDLFLLEKDLRLVVVPLFTFLSLSLLLLDRFRYLVDLLLQSLETDAARLSNLFAIVVVPIFRDGAVVLLIFALQILHFLVEYNALVAEDVPRVALLEVTRLQVVEDFSACFLLLLEFVQAFVILAPQDLNLVRLLLILELLFPDFFAE